MRLLSGSQENYLGSGPPVVTTVNRVPVPALLRDSRVISKVALGLRMMRMFPTIVRKKTTSVTIDAKSLAPAWLARWYFGGERNVLGRGWVYYPRPTQPFV